MAVLLGVLILVWGVYLDLGTVTPRMKMVYLALPGAAEDDWRDFKRKAHRVTQDPRRTT